MYDITNAVVGGGSSSSPNSFILRNQSLSFNNLTATVTDSRITADTLILNYYHNDAVAQAAGVSAVVSAGTITYTVTSTPSSTITVDIVCILEGLSAEPSAEDISYDNTGSGLTASDVQDAIDEVNNNIDALPIPKIYRGRGTFTNSGQSANLNFSSMGYTTPPTVMVTLEGGKSYTRGEIGDSSLYVSNVTTTNATVEVNRIANNNPVGFYFLVVGY